MLYSGGFAAAWQMIQTIAITIWEMAIAGVGLLLQFSDELGLSDWLTVRALYIAVALWAVCVAGYVFSRKEKRIVLGVISSVVGVVSAVLAFV